MNFLDPYDVAASSSTLTSEENHGRPQPSLEEEVNQVIGQLGGFWGRIRQQGQAALQTARKDFGDVVVQAQKEIGKYTAAGSPGAPTVATNAARDAPEGASASTSSSPSVDISDTASPPEVPEPTYQTLLSRFQSALPPNIASTLQDNIPESIKHASETIDFAQWRTTLSAEFQRIQGVTRAQAEEYVRKSEAMLKETMKEAGEAFKDAVKIIPPEGSVGASSSSDMIWDGTDMWMLPSESSDSRISSKGKGKEVATSSSAGLPGDVQRVATRAEALLKRLRHDPDIIKHDPDVMQLAAWVEKEVDTMAGGIDSEYWKARIIEEQNDANGAVLQATHNELVPSTMEDATFWKRYFFRVHQIRREEEKRKALLQAAEHEEDFSWEDDEDDAASPTTEQKPATPRSEVQSSTELTTPTPTRHTKDSSKGTNISSPQVLTPANTSPRGSEDGSYDVVSSSNASATGEKSKEADLSDGDSDWE